MFSEVKTGTHTGIVSATQSHAAERGLYLPNSVSGMAHRSWLSHNGKWMLISEMDVVGWRPCRVIPSDGSTSGEMAGPKLARCTYAEWSPDGKTMYFSADAGDGYHIWRQLFPRGAPEQLTFGPTEEEGVAISPGGQTLVTNTLGGRAFGRGCSEPSRNPMDVATDSGGRHTFSGSSLVNAVKLLTLVQDEADNNPVSQLYQ